MMTDTAPTILVIEDEVQIRRFIRISLEAEGWKVIEADSLKQGLISAGTRRPDLVILDLGLPDGDGDTLIRDLRTWSAVPVIVLSARSDESDKVTVLDSGADDYLTKPFSVPELLARIRANLRRQPVQGAQNQAHFEFGDVSVDFITRTIKKGGHVIHLTPIEYRLLKALIANVGRVLTHRQLLRDVWGANYSESNHYLRVYMGHLRQKLEDDPAQPKYLLTETAVGYRLLQSL